MVREDKQIINGELPGFSKALFADIFYSIFWANFGWNTSWNSRCRHLRPGKMFHANLCASKRGFQWLLHLSWLLRRHSCRGGDERPSLLMVQLLDIRRNQGLRCVGHLCTWQSCQVHGRLEVGNGVIIWIIHILRASGSAALGKVHLRPCVARNRGYLLSHLVGNSSGTAITCITCLPNPGILVTLIAFMPIHEVLASILPIWSRTIHESVAKFI